MSLNVVITLVNAIGANLQTFVLPHKIIEEQNSLINTERLQASTGSTGTSRDQLHRRLSCNQTQEQTTMTNIPQDGAGTLVFWFLVEMGGFLSTAPRAAFKLPLQSSCQGEQHMQCGHSKHSSNGWSFSRNRISCCLHIP